jgi:type I restriction-modification system DNA methylase subunit
MAGRRIIGENKHALKRKPSMDLDEEKRLESGRQTVRELVNKFEANRPYFKSNQFDETSTRTQFLDPFFSALGWDMADKAGKGPFADVLRERSVYGEVAGARVLLKPDYTFRVGGQPQICVEAKRPSADVDDQDSIFQIKNYAWNQSLSAGILTNFDQLRVLATRIQPALKRPWEGDLTKLHLSLGSYVDSFEDIWEVLSYDAVTRGGLARQAVAALGKTPGQRVDRAFLADLERWRLSIARDLAKSTALQGWELTEISQRLLDRLVFIRVCEDRHIEPKPLLKRVLGASQPRSELQEITQRLNVQYNGTLFKEHPADTAPVSDELLRTIIRTLYPPDSPYRFDVINVEILGTIYERFLGSEIVRTGPKQVRAENRPEVRKAGGVYYTPQWIVDEIVSMAVEPVVAGKSPIQLAKVKILDPACGSGSFLIGAFDRIVREYEAYYTAHPTVSPRDHYLRADRRRRLTERKRAQILVDNIFGVDVDPQAVEVTMMSLYLKALEGEDSASISNQRAAQTSLLQAALLPPLDRNIVCGNTLVSADSFQMELGGLETEELRRLNPFDWNDPAYRLRDVVRGGGFDAVIGNPPYFSVDATYGRKHPMLGYLKSQYPQVWQDKTDILFYFLAKAIQLSKRYVAFIVSRAFLEAYKAAKLRQTIATTAPAIELIDFQGFRVFADASISTAILLLDKTEANASRKTDVRRLATSEASAESVMAGIHDGSAPFERFETSLSQAGDPWFLVPESEREITALMDQGRPTLKDVALVGQGMQTGENDAFTITRKMADSFGVPEQLLKPRVRNSDVDRYSFDERDELLLYLEEVLEYKLLPTGVRSILEQPARKRALMSRAAYERGDCLWWRYTWPLHQERYGDPRLICPYRASNNRFALDGHFDVLSLTDTTVIFPNLDRKESPKYWLGLLNSRTLTYRMRRLAKLTGAGMYEYFWNAVEKLPMRTIDFGSGPDVKAHALIVGLVDELVQLAGSLRREKSPNQRSQLRRRFDAADKRLEGQVLNLYGISEEASRQEILSI